MATAAESTPAPSAATTDAARPLRGATLYAAIAFGAAGALVGASVHRAELAGQLFP